MDHYVDHSWSSVDLMDHSNLAIAEWISVRVTIPHSTNRSINKKLRLKEWLIPIISQSTKSNLTQSSSIIITLFRVTYKTIAWSGTRKFLPTMRTFFSCKVNFNKKNYIIQSHSSSEFVNVKIVSAFCLLSAWTYPKLDWRRTMISLRWVILNWDEKSSEKVYVMSLKP